MLPMAELILQDKERDLRGPTSSSKHLERYGKGTAQHYSPEHHTCETHARLRGFLAKAAEQLALFAVAARLEEDGPHNHAALHNKQKRLLDLRSPGLPLPAQAPPHADDHRSQGWRPKKKRALPSRRRSNRENEAAG